MTTRQTAERRCLLVYAVFFLWREAFTRTVTVSMEMTAKAATVSRST